MILSLSPSELSNQTLLGSTSVPNHFRTALGNPSYSPNLAFGRNMNLIHGSHTRRFSRLPSTSASASTFILADVHCHQCQAEIHCKLRQKIPQNENRSILFRCQKNQNSSRRPYHIVTSFNHSESYSNMVSITKDHCIPLIAI